MAEGVKDEHELILEAKRAILERIPGAVRSSNTGNLVLKLAMAYTVLDRGKLPGSDVGSE
ncbi:hypothetical protein [Micromonospora sp. NPDC023633]|uniref:hypothetical protein n=1 Tax=Micromonospora sp. NPDC023633 TaxID=3154320 RepID=UPI0033DE3F29